MAAPEGAPEMDATGMTKILLVDDSAHMRRYMSAILTSAGHEVSEATDGGEALAIVSSALPCVVITDLEMDGIGGEELVRRLRAREGAQPGIVVCSARVDSLAKEARERLETASVILAKPFRPRDLLEAIASAARA